jgi:hypothetical protein BACCOPRO_03221
MNTVPIVFAFDNRLTMPAAVAFTSLLMNANEDTFYDIFILHSRNEALDRDIISKVTDRFHNCRVTYRTIGDIFDNAFEIRQITTPAYYRLLIPELIPEYEKVLYSDVDVIFRKDLRCFYETDLTGYFFGGVNSMSHFDSELSDYYIKERKINPSEIIYSGNLLINCRKLREEASVTARILELAKGKYRFQDMDVINMACKGRIKYMPPEFCFTNYINKACVEKDPRLSTLWTEEELLTATTEGIVHYNGQKPWKGFCPNFDIWWEYYRKSPVFDQKYYFDFYYSRLNELDQLPLLKRIKILARYFVYGRRKNP